jgi:Tol biopolymer transport system component
MKSLLPICLCLLCVGAVWPSSQAQNPGEQTTAPTLESTLETYTLASKARQTVYSKRAHFEAPNWSRDGQSFVFNQAGRLYKLPVAGGEPQQINTGFALRCNNDHGLSPDGKWLAISDQSQEQRRSLIYVLPSTGGMPRRVTQQAPSYWHGWSPDGKTLAYCAERNGDHDIYTIPVEGGKERQLTTAKGLDDGPDYSPDGQYVYFNSDRTGLMQIWRMRLDGSEQTQITHDEYNNWFPHPSPDGKWLVFLSYAKEVKGHPANKEVLLRLLPVSGGETQVLTKLLGGQGTLNVPSWAPDSTQFAFVSYRLIEP